MSRAAALMAVRHTPGPWKPYFGETYHVTGPDGGRVAICMNLKGAHGLAGRRTSEEVTANAHLIAAAPDLLAALQGLLHVYQGMGNPRGQKEIEAEAAIIKAIGGQS